MVKVGWMVDPGLPRAGMVLSVDAFAAASPHELVLCYPNRRPPRYLDAFVLHGDLFNRRWISVLREKPFMAHRHGGWHGGDPIMRRWVLENAALVTFNSPKQRELFRYAVDVPFDFVPLPIDIDSFMVTTPVGREGTIFLGLIAAAKGISYTVDWAMRNQHPIDFYGEILFRGNEKLIEPPCTYCGGVDYERVPALLGRYNSFIFQPYEPDLYSRTVVEAYAAGCDLILEGDEQALWDWLDLDACRTAASTFWQKFETIL